MSSDNPHGASPEERDAGLMRLFDAAATCDHDTDVDWDEWAATIRAVNNHNQDNKFTYIFGMEWSGYQHIFYITLNPSPTPKNVYNSDFNEVKELAAWLAANQGIGWYAHPVCHYVPVDFSNPANYDEKSIPLVEMVSAGGGGWFWNYYWDCAPESGCSTYSNPRMPGTYGYAPSTPSSQGWIKYALDHGLHLGFVGVADANGVAETPLTGLANVPSWTREGVYYALKNRHTWAAEDKIKMSVTTNTGARDFIMGDIFNYASATPNLTINYDISAAPGKTISKVSLFYKGVIVKVTSFSGRQNVTGNFSQKLTPGVEEYLFLEAIQSDGKRAWSSPMWVTYKYADAPVLRPIGDKSVSAGNLLTFTVNAADSNNDALAYSAYNLPSGANFDPNTRTFRWTPGSDQVGTYPGVHFEVRSGSLSDSENITITVTTAQVLYGDVSGDGEISAYDAALTAQAAVELSTLTAEQGRAADVNGDGEVNAYDAALIAQKAVGLIDKFPAED